MALAMTCHDPPEIKHGKLGHGRKNEGLVRWEIIELFLGDKSG
jgi:hypothetical protein